jgi:hypothetical protein
MIKGGSPTGPLRAIDERLGAINVYQLQGRMARAAEPSFAARKGGHTFQAARSTFTTAIPCLTANYRQRSSILLKAAILI